ncbi:MAG TPA: PAS domain S-box protein, partial [Thermoleophilia bacterium]|nr:PAS domain S-box protein [Thermoleophilia bacterium]
MMRHTFTELVDVTALQGLTDALHRATGIPSAVITTEGEVLTASGWQRICTDFHRTHPDIEKECIQSDTAIRASLAAGDAFAVYTCPRSLTDASMPVIIEGEHLANVFMGQLFTEAPDESTERFFREQSRRFGLDEGDYLEAFREIPVFSEERFRLALSFLAELARSVASSGLSRLRELETTARLDAERSKYRIVADNTYDWEFWLSSEGRFSYVSPSCERVSGHTPQEFEEDPELMARIIHPDDRDLFLAHMRSALGGHTAQELTFRIIRADGGVRFLEHICVPVSAEDGTFLGLRGSNRDITARKQAEEALHASEERYRTILDLSPIPWAMNDDDGNITFLNEAFVDTFGYTLEEIPTLADWWPRAYPDPEYRQWVSSTWKHRLDQANLEGTPFDPMELRVNCKDGAVLTVLASAALFSESPGREHLVILYDITERKQAEEALRESEERYRRLFELESDAIVLVDNGSGQVLEVNEAASVLYGYSREEWLSMNHTDVSAEPDSTRRAAVEGERLIPIRWHRKRDGTVFPVEITAGHFEWKGRSVHVAAIRDITERTQAEEEHLRLERQLQHSQKLESLGVLAGGIAHDFNNILLSVLGNADLALDELSPSAPARENLLAITAASRRAADLCRQMLAYSGRGHFVIEPIDLDALIRDLLGLLESTISKKARLDLSLEQGLPRMRGDASQLSQVVMNLVINASEAIGDNDGVITISTGVRECPREHLCAIYSDKDLPSGLYLTLEVSDTGSGMDAETRDRLFEPFYTTKFTGRGLGLAAVQGIVRGHGGALELESTPGRGTTFTVYLPIADTEVGTPVSASVETTADWQGRGIVLLVDDEETVRSVGRRMLERLGF